MFKRNRRATNGHPPVDVTSDFMLDEKDPAFVQSQIDAMLSLLDEKPNIRQQVDDSKLKPAK